MPRRHTMGTTAIAGTQIKCARDTMALTGVTEGDIDDFYGWDQRQRKKKSQLHYHGRTDRLHRAKVTMML